jgi:hypothetical protein
MLVQAFLGPALRPINNKLPPGEFPQFFPPLAGLSHMYSKLSSPFYLSTFHLAFPPS